MNAEEIAEAMEDLVSFPQAALRARDLLDSPTASAADIGEVISLDPALSARLLKLVNSSFYQLPAPVDSISRAITLIGTRELGMLILATSVKQAFAGISLSLYDMDKFWHRSVFCGLVSKKLARLCGAGKGEMLFLIGLLHDVGRLALFAHAPEGAQKILTRSAETGRSLAELESEMLGFDAAHIGALLLESWRLPQSLWEPVRYQHRPGLASEYAAQTQVLNLALGVTNVVEPELVAPEPGNLASLETVKVNGVDLSSDDLNEVAAAANLECFEVLAIINPRAATIF